MADLILFAVSVGILLILFFTGAPIEFVAALFVGGLMGLCISLLIRDVVARAFGPKGD